MCNLAGGEMTKTDLCGKQSITSSIKCDCFGNSVHTFKIPVTMRNTLCFHIFLMQFKKKI